MKWVHTNFARLNLNLIDTTVEHEKNALGTS